MQLPQYKKKKRIKLKNCKFSGCGIEFWGHPIAKYCKTHQNIKLRLKTKKETEIKEREKCGEESDVNNQYFKHEYNEVVDMEFTCSLKGCGNKFTVRIFPKQFIYPKYCSDHRTPFRREVFSKVNKKVAK